MEKHGFQFSRFWFILGLVLVLGLCTSCARQTPAQKKLEKLQEELADNMAQFTGKKKAETPQATPVQQQAVTVPKDALEAEKEYQLGVKYSTGDGVEKNPQAAAEHFLKSAQLGNVKAQTAYGACCYYGTGIPQDYKTAFFWLEKSASRDDANAIMILAHALMNGNGIGINYSKARSFYELAAALGLAKAKLNLALIYEYGLGVDPNEKMAAKWFLLAANAGEPAAQYYIGKACIEGRGIRKNELEGNKWLRRAEHNGWNEAQPNFDFPLEPKQSEATNTVPESGNQDKQN